MKRIGITSEKETGIGKDVFHTRNFFRNVCSPLRDFFKLSELSEKLLTRLKKIIPNCNFEIETESCGIHKMEGF